MVQRGREPAHQSQKYRQPPQPRSSHSRWRSMVFPFSPTRTRFPRAPSCPLNRGQSGVGSLATEKKISRARERMVSGMVVIRVGKVQALCCQVPANPALRC